MKNLLTLCLSLVILSLSINGAIGNTVVTVDPQNNTNKIAQSENSFLGTWTLDIEGGGVGWLEIFEKEGFLDANLLWIGGSVLPVGHIYKIDENNLIITRSYERVLYKDENGEERKHSPTYTLTVTKVGNEITGRMVGPNWNNDGQTSSAFIGRRLPPVPAAPNLAKLKYGQPIQLFNGKDLTGWQLINPKNANGFKVIDSELVNDPIQPEDDKHVYYGNLRTTQTFKDFNLTLEVNVPEGNNSGVYLRGMYEIQVLDSYGKELDSHHMGALYSRITPSTAAEKPGGTWQSLDITLCDRHVTVKLNGTTIIDNQPAHGPTGGAIISDVFAPGPIYLQGDHGKVSYRNMVLRPILN